MLEVARYGGYMPPAKTNKHSTPAWLLEDIRKEFGQYFDPCPIDWDESKPDGLSISWGPVNYVNPPYSKSQWQNWVKKAYDEMLKGKKSIMLLPSRTDTKAFHNIILKESSEIRFFQGRLTFGSQKETAVFASILVVFDPFRPGPPEIKSIVAR